MEISTKQANRGKGVIHKRGRLCQRLGTRSTPGRRLLYTGRIRVTWLGCRLKILDRASWSYLMSMGPSLMAQSLV